MKRLTSVLLSVGLASVVISANAKTATLKVNGMVSNTQSATFSYVKSGTTTSQNVRAGFFNAQLDNGPAFTAYCVDLFQSVNVPDQYTVDIRSTDDLNYPGLTPSAGKRVAWLYNTYAADAATSAFKAAGLQLAIWETSYEDVVSTPYSLTGGDFQIKSVSDQSIMTFANGYLGGLQSANGQSTASWLYSSSKQDLIGPSVPEPGSLALLGSSFIGLGTMMFRRRRA